MTLVSVERAHGIGRAQPWKRVTLNEICRTTSGGTPPRRRSEYFGGAIPWVKSGELTDGLVSEVEEFITEDALANSNAKIFPSGTLLIALYGATVGKLGVLARAAATNQAVCAIFPSAELDTKFLFWYLRCRRVDLVAQAVGGAQPNISQTILRNLDVPVPPIDEQHSIVAEIEKQFSRLDEAVANLKRVKVNLKRYKAAVLKAAVEGRLVDTEAELARREGRGFQSAADLVTLALQEHREAWTGRGKYVQPRVSDGINAQPLPDGWLWTSAEQICLSIASGSTPSAEKMFAGDGEIPFIKVYNLTFDGLLDFSIKPTFIAAGMHTGQLGRSRCFPGDVLMNIVGPPLGKVSIVPGDYPEWNINQAVVSFRVSRAILNHLLAYWLMSLPILGRLKRTAKATAGQFNLQVTTCRRLMLPLPPMAEQHRIVAEVDRRLSLVREVEAEVNANLNRAEALRQATLSRAFSPIAAGLVEGR